VGVASTSAPKRSTLGTLDGAACGEEKSPKSALKKSTLDANAGAEMGSGSPKSSKSSSVVGGGA